MTADEMFIELGYKRRYGDDTLMIYEKTFEIKSKREPIRKVIGFDLIKEEIYVFESYIDVEYKLFGDVDMQEFKAINKKIEELGW